MGLKDLSADQKLEPKQAILFKRKDKKKECPSYEELANADKLVSDKALEREYGSTRFVEEDFSK